MVAPTTQPDPLKGILECGTIALLNGSPNAGKTALLAGILARFHTGGNLFGWTLQPTPVFYIVMDRLWRTGAGKWFDKLGFDIPHYSFVDDRETPASVFYAKTPQNQRQPWEVYTDLILTPRELAPGTIIGTDPMENGFGDVMNRRAVITACTHIQRYLDDHQLVQLGMMHSSKMKNDEKARYANVHEQMAGTGALSGYSSTQMTLLSPQQCEQEGQEHYEFHITSHSLPAMVFGLTRLEDGLFDLDNYKVLQASSIQPTAEELAAPMSEGAQALLIALPDFPKMMKMDVLVAHFKGQMSRKTLYKHMNELAARGYAKSPQYGHWSRVVAEPAPHVSH